MKMFHQIFAVCEKEARSELRTRYALSAMIMFIVATTAAVAFGGMQEKFDHATASVLLWIILLFTAMTSLPRTFVQEYERKTVLWLRFSATSEAVFFGKLLYNTLLTIILFACAVVIFFLLVNVKSSVITFPFVLLMFVGTCATSAALTVLGAIVAQAQTQAALLPALALPILLPLVVSGVEATSYALSGAPFSDIRSDILILSAYTVVLVTASYLLFDYIWEE